MVGKWVSGDMMSCRMWKHSLAADELLITCHLLSAVVSLQAVIPYLGIYYVATMPCCQAVTLENHGTLLKALGFP